MHNQNAIISLLTSLNSRQRINTLLLSPRTDQSLYLNETKHLKAYSTHLTLIPSITLINHIQESFIHSHSHMMRNSSLLELETNESRSINLEVKMEAKLFSVKYSAIQSQQFLSLLVRSQHLRKQTRRSIRLLWDLKMVSSKSTNLTA